MDPACLPFHRPHEFPPRVSRFLSSSRSFPLLFFIHLFSLVVERRCKQSHARSRQQKQTQGIVTQTNISGCRYNSTAFDYYSHQIHFTRNIFQHHVWISFRRIRPVSTVKPSNRWSSTRLPPPDLDRIWILTRLSRILFVCLTTTQQQ
jgi:hypothetical protein